MPLLRFQNPLEPPELLRSMREDARFDAASASDPVAACPPGFLSGCIQSKAPPPKVPKVFLSNQCSFNCAYCGCRAGNPDKTRYCVQPREMARIAVEEAKRNRHGVFLTSAVYKAPTTPRNSSSRPCAACGRNCIIRVISTPRSCPGPILS